MRDKARDFFEEAKVLVVAKKYNGAASRLYYSLYHVITSVFEEKGIKQSDLTTKVDPEKPGYWLHEVVRDYAALAGLERRDSGIARHMWELRTRADYRTGRVELHEIQEMMKRVESVLNDLGVKTK